MTCDPADGCESLFKRNPILVIEVLSESEAGFDRGEKFAGYRQLESLREYVLIEPERVSVDLFRRDPNGNWVLHSLTEDSGLKLTSIDLSCRMAAVYEDVDV